MKTIILLLSVMLITGVAAAKRTGHGNDHGKRYKSEQRDADGSSLQKHKRKWFKNKNRSPEEIKQHEEKVRKRLRRMANGDKAEYNRLMELRKNDPKAFRAEMQERRAKINKNRKHNRKKNKGDMK